MIIRYYNKLNLLQEAVFMNLKQLEYFIAVAESLNFTKAAKKCYISQTAITLQIQSLEKRLGVSLFIRDKHHVELTAAGKVYLNEARAILIRAEEAAKLARTASEGVTGELSVGFIRGYEQSRFSETLRTFREAYPNISLHLIRDNMSALYHHLEDNSCDIVLNLSLAAQGYENMTHRFLKRFPLMAVLYPGHPLSGHNHLSYRDLAQEDFIIMQPHGRATDEAEEVLLCYNRGGFIPHIISRDREVQTVLLEVSAGFGIAILPEYAVRYYYNARNLIVLPLLRSDGTPEEVDFEIIWKTENNNPSIEKLLQWMETHDFTE